MPEKERPVSLGYEEGRQAYREGKAYFANPHVMPKSNRHLSAAWGAGWMREWQGANRLRPKEETER